MPLEQIAAQTERFGLSIPGRLPQPHNLLVLTREQGNIILSSPYNIYSHKPQQVNHEPYKSPTAPVEAIKSFTRAGEYRCRKAIEKSGMPVIIPSIVSML